MNLQTSVLGITFNNPLVLASGPMGLVASGWERLVTLGAGGITTKTCWQEVREGHPSPVILSTPEYTLNAVGLSASGWETSQQEISSFQSKKVAPIIVSIGGKTLEEYAANTKKYVSLKPDLLEVNISCPNVKDEMGTPFAYSADLAAEVTSIVKKHAGSVPVSIKLSPNVTNIGAIAKACIDAGADAITAINTAGPGLQIDLKSRLPILSNHTGGISGPAIRPLALRCVADIYKATNGSVPIIGTGGVQSGEDALAMIMAGASLVGIGTGLWNRGEDVFKKTIEEMQLWCTNQNIENIADLVGAMHTTIKERDIKPGQRNPLYT